MARNPVKDLLIAETLDDLESNSPGARERIREQFEARQRASQDHPKGKPLLLNEAGAGAYEVPDPVPMEPPLGYKRQPSLFDQVRELVQGEISRRAEVLGMDTFEEADDFDVEDGFDIGPDSPYEVDFEPLPPGELTRRKLAAEAAEPAPEPPAPPPAPAGAPAPEPAPEPLKPS